MTDQPGWGRPDEEPTPPHPGWSPEQPPVRPPTPPQPAPYQPVLPPGSAPPPPAPPPPTPPPAPPYPHPGQQPPPGYPQVPPGHQQAPPGHQQVPPPGYPPYPPAPGYPQAYGGYAYAPPPAPKPGVIPLRPLAVGEILDGAIQCVRANPKIMLGLSAVVVTISQLISFGLTLLLAQDLSAIDPATASPDEVFSSLGDLAGVGLIGGVITFIAQAILAGVLTVVVSKAVLGQTITLGEAWTQLRPRLLRLLGLTIVVALASGLGLIFCIIPGVFLWTMWWVAGPALILERTGIFPSMGRSWFLIKGSFWRTFLVVLLTVILTQVIAGIVAIPFSLITDFSAFSGGGSFGTISTMSLFGSTLGAIVGGTLTAPFTAAVTVLLYVDRRMRLEGLDLELARAAAAQRQPGGPPAP